MKMSLVFSFRMLGNLLKRSPTDIIMLAFTPKSMLELSSAKIVSMFSWQMREETHMNLHRARIADLSRMQILGGAQSGCWYFWRAVFTTRMIVGRNLPRSPF